MDVRRCTETRKRQNTVEVVDTSYPPFSVHYLASILPQEGHALLGGVFRWLIDATHCEEENGCHREHESGKYMRGV